MGKTYPNNNQPTDASKIYDVVYGHIASITKTKIKNSTKSARVEKILATMDFDEATALRLCCKNSLRFTDPHFERIAKISGIDRKKLVKDYNLGTRHMLSPNNIRIAVPSFYNLKGKNNTRTEIKDSDFGQQKYIKTRLNNSGIYTREVLLRHLSLGWYYLWTIPGCGDNARMSILLAIDKWKSES